MGYGLVGRIQSHSEPAMPHPPPHEKPEVLKRKGSLMRFLAILVGLAILIYVGVAATAFLRTERDPASPPHGSGNERTIDGQAN